MDVKTNVQKTALELFNKSGSEKISTNEIAKTAQISPGTLYYYFKNKEEIINAIFIDMSNEYEEEFEKRIDLLAGFNKQIYLFDDSEFFNKYSFIFSELGALLRNNKDFFELNKKFNERREKHLFLIFKLLQNQEIIIQELNDNLIMKIIRIVWFNKAYNPLKSSNEKNEIEQLLPIYGFLTEKGKEFFETENIIKT